jgi:hypothetical protein
MKKALRLNLVVTISTFILLGGVLSIIINETAKSLTSSDTGQEVNPNTWAILIMVAIELILLVSDIVINLIGINNIEHRVTQILLNKLLCCAIAVASLSCIVVCSVDYRACFVSDCTKTDVSIKWTGFVGALAVFNFIKLYADVKCIDAAHKLN